MAEGRLNNYEQAKLARIEAQRRNLPLLASPFAFAIPVFFYFVPDRWPTWAVLAIVATLLAVMVTPLVYLTFFLRCPRCSSWIVMPKCPSCGLKLKEPARR